MSERVKGSGKETLNLDHAALSHRSPAARGTLDPSSNKAGASSSLRRTFSTFPLLSWFAEDKRDKTYNSNQGKYKSVTQKRGKYNEHVFDCAVKPVTCFPSADRNVTCLIRVIQNNHIAFYSRQAKCEAA